MLQAEAVVGEIHHALAETRAKGRTPVPVRAVPAPRAGLVVSPSTISAGPEAEAQEALRTPEERERVGRRLAELRASAETELEVKRRAGYLLLAEQARVARVRLAFPGSAGLAAPKPISAGLRYVFQVSYA